MIRGTKPARVWDLVGSLHIALFAAFVYSSYASAEATPDPPNVVIIFTDDQGYGDLGCFGGEHVSTPRIDRMAAEGARLTSFYVGGPVCTPSRAALMTGSYPRRVDMAKADSFGVVLAADRKGLNPAEVTLAEVLKGAGYVTGIFGKWHLGDQPEFLPTRQGFDEFFGLPYSHDIHPFHPRQDHYNFPPLPLLEGETVIELDPDANFLTRRITERAVSFIAAHRDEPFFLYLPHPIPHRPLYASPPFMDDVAPEIRTKLAEENDGVDYPTRDKIYTQAINEIDWSVGEILDALRANGLDERTLVIFTSDNGPSVGSAGPLKGKKGGFHEGGPRVPAVVRWPGRIPAGQSIDGILTAMDLFPTFAHLAGTHVPSDRVIDGVDILSVLTEETTSPRDIYFYHQANDLKAVRKGKWKLHVEEGQPTALFDLQRDIGEANDVLSDHPGVAAELVARIAAFEQDLSVNSRPAAFVDNPQPLRLIP